MLILRVRRLCAEQRLAPSDIFKQSAIPVSKGIDWLSGRVELLPHETEALDRLVASYER